MVPHHVRGGGYNRVAELRRGIETPCAVRKTSYTTTSKSNSLCTVPLTTSTSFFCPKMEKLLLILAMFLSSCLAFDWTVRTPDQLIIGQQQTVYWSVDNSVAPQWAPSTFEVWLIDSAGKRAQTLASTVNSRSGQALVTPNVPAGNYQVMVFAASSQTNSRISNPFPVRASPPPAAPQPVPPNVPFQPVAPAPQPTQTFSKTVAAVATTVQPVFIPGTMTKPPTFSLATRPANAPPGYIRPMYSSASKNVISGVLFILLPIL
jgi:hypothetical protein